MAAASLAARLDGIAGPSTFSIQNELNSSKGRKLHHAMFIKTYRHLYHHGYSMQSQNCSHKETLPSFKALSGEEQPMGGGEDEDIFSTNNNFSGVNKELFRQKLENIVGSDDTTFDGKQLAMLIRSKYGRSYDVQLVKKEFMGRQLLAMNVMWKYREQRSFPLTEEEYLLHLDDVANNLKCWGAVSYVRNSLAKKKERPRIGKAVSIFIDLDESGGRANEWIYR